MSTTPTEDQIQTAYFFGYIGIAAAFFFANLGSAYGKAKSWVGIWSMGALKPDKIIKSGIPLLWQVSLVFMD